MTLFNSKLARIACSAPLRIGAALAFSLCLTGIYSETALAASSAATEIKPDEIFRKSCAVCHGERGNGRGRASANLVPPPRDFTLASNLTREAMINAITYGRPGTAMMSWTKKYNAQQIAAVVDYIRGRFMLVALDPNIEKGRGVYGHFCQVCHGDRGQGAHSADARNNPRDWTVPANQSDLTRDRMITAVLQGKHGTTPAGFSDKVSAENAAAVVDYIRKVLLPNLAAANKAESAALPPAAKPAAAASVPPSPGGNADMSLPLPKGLAGDIKRGEKFFLGNCATCHGIQGNGDGPRAYFINPRPRNFHDEYSHTRLNRPALFAAITGGKPGTVMPAWGKVLSEQEIANVAEFVFQTFIQEKTGAKARAK